MARRGESAREAQRFIRRTQQHYRRRRLIRRGRQVVVLMVFGAVGYLVYLFVANPVATPSAPISPPITAAPPPTLVTANPSPTKAPSLDPTPTAAPTPTAQFIPVPTSVSSPPTSTPEPTTTLLLSVSPTVRPTPKPTPTLIPTRIKRPRPDFSPPVPTLADLKIYLLELINEDRLTNGLSSVKLSDNPAAQQHAEEMLEHSYTGHWGLDGLKPYMRYTLAGGVNYEAENAYGLDSPLDLTLFHLTESPKSLLMRAERSLMGSRGHRVNILDPWHKKVSLGIACNRAVCAVVQQFEGDYISFRAKPHFSSGRLEFAGEMSDGFEISEVQIWYDRPPHAVTLGQLDTTRSYCHGLPVAFLNKPLLPGSSYNESSSLYNWEVCQSPYDSPADIPRKKREGFETTSIPVPLAGVRQVPWITATSWNTQGHEFSVVADISDILNEHGPGIYTIHIWGKNAGQEVLLANYSIFYDGN